MWSVTGLALCAATRYRCYPRATSMKTAASPAAPRHHPSKPVPPPLETRAPPETRGAAQKPCLEVRQGPKNYYCGLR